MPMEIDPRKAFERMFGQGGTAAERALRTQQDRSILDEITAEAGVLKTKLGKRDQATLSDYLDSVREIERRIERANFDTTSSIELPTEPVGIPYNFEEHINIMYDMLVLAYQANITRVFTYMVAREESNKTYPQVGVHDGHHATSHHQNLPEKIEKLVKIQSYHATLFARFLGKLKATPDGDGTLLDHSVLLYGSNMSNSNLHNHFPLPNVVAGGACGKLQGGRHLRYEDHTPMANLLLSLLDKSGIPMPNLGDSTGELVNI
jgi:hypothetical protein